MNEVWKDIQGYEGLYQVSNLGRIKRLESIVVYVNEKKHLHRECILKSRPTLTYQQVSLSKNGILKYPLVHRIVAQTFIPNPNNKPQVNHKDGNKANNCVDNLEWATSSENIKHAFRVLGRIPTKPTLGKRGKLHHNSKPIICINTNEYFESAGMAAEKLGLHRALITKVLTGKYKSTGGYKFKFAV